jgi:hypothetical protein
VLGCTPEAFGICLAASWGWHEATRAGGLEVVKLLLDAGADAGRRNADGKTALDLARERPDHAGCGAVVAWLAGSALEPRRP